ncbi:MAG: response regulator transcription factor [Anaerolineales bacterium]|nr:response regulator transcription factor [Anaerolineales bacterium]
MTKIRVLLVDDHAILREGLRALLSCYDDVQVVGEAKNGAVALEQVEALQPDVVIMDIAMPVMDGFESTRQIRLKYPQTRVLVLTQYEDKEYVVPLLRAGASGFVLKQALGADLINALRTVAQGETFLYPSVATVALEELRQPSKEEETGSTLTPREREILQYIVAGKTNAQIATALMLSIKTVEWHRGNLMGKLGVHSVADLVRHAIQHRLVKED